MDNKLEELTNIDQNVLTPLEIFYISGGTFSDDWGKQFRNEPEKPIGIKKGLFTIEQINEIRAEREVAGVGIGALQSLLLIGGKGTEGTPVFLISEISESGRALSWPKLTGFLQADGSIKREELMDYKLTIEGQQELEKAFPSLTVGAREKKG